MSRYFHYVQTVQHKTASAFEAVAKELVYRTIRNCETSDFYKDFNSLVSSIGTDNFYGFTDDFMWNCLNKYCHDSTSDIDNLLWRTIYYREKPKNIIFAKDVVRKRKSKTDKKPVGDAEYFLINWMAEKNQAEIAKKCGYDIEQFGFTSTSISIESIPSFMKIEECHDLAEESLRDAIKIVSKNGKVSFLASDNTSLINKMVDYTSESINLFLVDPDNKVDIKRVRDEIYRLIQ